MNQPRSRVGKNALLVGRVWRFTLRICPMYTNPVKKMIVKVCVIFDEFPKITAEEILPPMIPQA
jgi:hypothetical protein